MKFILAETLRYWWPVTVRVPSRDIAGEMVEQHFEMLFEPEGQDAAVERAKALAADPTPHAIAQAQRDHLATVCRGWRGVVDDTGGEVPFSAEFLGQALQMSWFRAGVSAAYRESLAGEAARLGN